MWPSGSGKSTLLQQLKKEIAPEGIRSGRLFYNNKDIIDLDDFAKFGYWIAFQEPDVKLLQIKL